MAQMERRIRRRVVSRNWRDVRASQGDEAGRFRIRKFQNIGTARTQGSANEFSETLEAISSVES